MDFQPSAEQAALAEGIRSFLDDRLPVGELAVLAERAEPDIGLHREIAQLDVFRLRLAESAGGLGLGMADAVLVYAELGRRLVPGTAIDAGLAAGIVPGVESGEQRVCFVDALDPACEPVLVDPLATTDALLVLHADGVDQVATAGLTGSRLENPLDPLTPLEVLAEVPSGERIGGSELAIRLRRDGMVLSAAMGLGICEETLALALAHAKAREQFDRPIGSFQAIKHLLADMFARLEHTRALVYAAGATLDHPEVGNPDQAARAAKLLADESAMKNARTCVQVFGGMGYTWETPAHYFLKRCWVLANRFGGVDEHADVLAAAVAGGADAR